MFQGSDCRLLSAKGETQGRPEGRPSIFRPESEVCARPALRNRPWHPNPNQPNKSEQIRTKLQATGASPCTPKLPADQICAPDEAGAEAYGHHDHPFLETPFGVSFVQPEWDRCTAGVSVLLDVEEDFVFGEFEPVSC